LNGSCGLKRLLLEAPPLGCAVVHNKSNHEPFTFSSQVDHENISGFSTPP